MLKTEHYTKVNPLFPELTFEHQQEFIHKENSRLAKLVSDDDIKTVIANNDEFCSIITVDDEDRIFFSTFSEKPPVILRQHCNHTIVIDRTEPDIITIRMHNKKAWHDYQEINIERVIVPKLIAVLQKEIGLCE